MKTSPATKRALAIVAFSLLGHLAVLGEMWFILALRDVFAVGTLIAIVCSVAFAKTCFYGVLLRRITLAVVSSATRFHAFLLTMTGLMFVAMASYAVDFATVFTLDPTSIAAMLKDDPVYVRLFNAWYFSVLNFSFFGVADYIPTTIATRFLLALEALASFLTLIFILSDFAALRESMRHASGEPYETPP